MPVQTHALIIGSGIAGPAIALFLSKAGIGASIYEAYPAPAGIGGGLGLAPNGMNVLAELGLAEALVDAGTICAAFAFRNQRGQLIGTIPNGPPGRFGQPAVTLSRARLHQILLEALARQGIAVAYRKRLAALEEGPTGVLARFADGSEASGDLLVGADGIDSCTRNLILPTGPKPAFTGLVGVGGFVPRQSIPIERPEDEQTERRRLPVVAAGSEVEPCSPAVTERAR